MSGHDRPEQAVTFKRNGWSRWCGIRNFQEYLNKEPENVFFELTKPREFSVVNEKTRDGVMDNLVVEIPAEIMDDIAIAWIEKRKLQGALGGPVGNELGSPDTPWLWSYLEQRDQ